MLRTVGVATSGDAPAAGNVQQRGQYNRDIDPFQVRMSAAYGVGAASSVKVDYQFARSSYGYIVRVEQDGEAYTMGQARERDALAAKQDALIDAGEAVPEDLARSFASGHEEAGADAITGVAEASATDAALAGAGDEKARLRERSKRLDATTKIAGEGARWQAVRALASGGTLTNASRFYALKDAADAAVDAPVWFVDFRTLWGAWKSKFATAFDIPDATVAEALRASGDGWGGGGRQDGRRDAMTPADHRVG
jgi:hypothetical protein